MRFSSRIPRIRKPSRAIAVFSLGSVIFPVFIFAQSALPADSVLLDEYRKSVEEGKNLELQMQALEKRIAEYKARTNNDGLIEDIKKKIKIVNPYPPNAAFEDQMRTRLARQFATVPDIQKRLTPVNLRYDIREVAPGQTDYVFRGTNRWMEPQDFNMVVQGPNEEELLNTLRHEGEHPYIAFQAGCPVAKGIEEGLATFFGEKPKYIAQHYRDLAAYPRMFPVSQLYAMKEYPKDGTTILMYHESTALAEFLYRTLEANLGSEKQQNAYRNIMIGFALTAQSKGLDAAMREYQGQFGFNDVSVAQLEQQFRGFVEKRIQEVGPAPKVK